MIYLLINGVFAQHLSRHHFSTDSGGSLFAGWIIGPILIAFSFILLVYNQKASALNHIRYDRAQQIVTDVVCTQPNRQNNNKLIYTTGRIANNQMIVDPETLAQVGNASALRRTVQKREQVTTGQGQNRRTELQWVQVPQTTSQFAPLRSKTIFGRSLTVGNFFLSEELKQKLENYQSFGIDPRVGQQTKRYYQGYNISTQGNCIYAYKSYAQQRDSFKISYQYVPCGDVSILSGQVMQNNFYSFSGYTICQRDQLEKQEKIQDMECSCGTCCCFMCKCTRILLQPIQIIDFIEQTYVTKPQFFQNLRSKQRTITWVLRLVSYLCLAIGIYSLFTPITNLLGYIPLLGGFLKGVLGVLIFIAAALVALPIWLFAATIVWFFYHPKIALILLGVGLAIAGLIVGLSTIK